MFSAVIDRSMEKAHAASAKKTAAQQAFSADPRRPRNLPRNRCLTSKNGLARDFDREFATVGFYIFRHPPFRTMFRTRGVGRNRAGPCGRARNGEDITVAASWYDCAVMRRGKGERLGNSHLAGHDRSARSPCGFQKHFRVWKPYLENALWC